MQEELKACIEALLFAAPEPLSEKALAELTGASPKEVEAALRELLGEYQERMGGFLLYPLAGGWQLRTREEFAELIEKLHRPVNTTGLSPAALETLAIIAYKQPVTRAVMERIRGVRVDSALQSLLERGLVEEVGRLDEPGRPILYGTTTKFLDHLGLNSLDDLPPLPEEEVL